MTKTLLKKRVSILAFICLMISQIAFSQVPPNDLNGEDLKSWLRTNYYDGKHQTLGYTQARVYLYNYIDNENNTITCVYSGYEVNSTYGGTTTYPAPINCEHTVPQSYFGESDPMVSDIHHLFPTYENWNSTRSNYPLTDIDDNDTEKWMYLNQSQTTIPTSNIDLYSEYDNSTFEPREDHKGNAARAIFYFYTMYPTQAGNISQIGDINIFYQWHLDDPVDALEIERNNEIETYQGNRNPYIDYPEIVASAWGFATVETPPSIPTLQINAGATSIALSWNDVSTENGYKIYKSIGGSSYNLLSDLAANVTNYNDNSVSEGITYSYYIIAYNEFGNSTNSNIVSDQLNTGGETGTTTDLLFSEYIEGSSYNKGLEVANFTGATLDLTNYSIRKQTNGAGDWGTILTLSGSLVHGDVFVVVNSSASAEMKAVADLETGVDALTFNGNDALGLFKNGTLIDMLGVFNSSATYAQDVTLVRNSDILSPNTTYTTSEWTSYSSDTFTYLGSHTVDGEATDTEAPTTPSSLAYANVTESSLDLSWIASTDNIEVTGYDIYKDGNLIATSVSTLYNVTGLSESTTYAFYVKAKDAAGNISNASNTVNVTTLTPPDTEAPTSPTSLAYANVTTSSVDLSWTASTDNIGVTGYDIYKDGNLLASSVSTSYDVTGLSESTAYTFYVKAKDAAGNISNASNTVNVYTGETGGTADLLFSEYIEGSSYNKGLEVANFTGATLDLTNYSIRKQTNGAGDWGTILTLSGSLAHGNVFVVVNSSASAEMKAVADLETGADALTFNGNDALGLFKNGTLIDMLGVFNSSTNYALDVTLVRNSNILSPNTTYTTSEWTNYPVDTYTYLGSHTVDGETTDTEAPTAPASLAYTNITTSSVDLSWTASTDNVGVTGYDIFKDGNLLASSVSTSYSVTGLTASTMYAFYVKANDAAGNISNASNTVNVTTLTPSDTEAPTAPASLAYANITTTSVDLSWTASTDNVGVTGYDIFKDGNLLASSVSNSYNVTGLTASTMYAFYVKAKDAAGNISNASNTVNVTTTDAQLTYCESYGTNTSDEWLNQVEIADLDNYSGNNGGFADFSNLTANLEINTSYNLTLYAGYSGRYYKEIYSIWIDYNQDGIFDESSELAFTGSSRVLTISGSFTVPSNALVGTTKMRVSIKYNKAATPCEIFTYGEVEDYTVNIGGASSIPLAKKMDAFAPASLKIKLYPNPANMFTTLELITNESTVFEYKVVDLQGRILLAKNNISVKGYQEEKIDVSGLQSGIYFILISNQNIKETHKLIIK